MAIQHGRTHSWRKSSHSGGNGACVEVISAVPEALAVRDSKVAGGPQLSFPAGAWTAFVDTVGQERQPDGR